MLLRVADSDGSAMKLNQFFRYLMTVNVALTVAPVQKIVVSFISRSKGDIVEKFEFLLTSFHFILHLLNIMTFNQQ